MKYISHKYPILAALLASITITACEPDVELDDVSPTEASGTADFTTYVALGNSLTAGYADNALYREGQINSYPAIIANMMKTINPELDFAQPLIPAGGGLGFGNGSLIGKIVITGFGADGRPSLVPIAASEGALTPVTGPFQNLGVPGAKVGDLTMPGYGSSLGNPYFARFASSPGATIVGEAVAQNPTFFTLWIGNNDVLGYATAGGVGTITDPATFEGKYRLIVSSMIAANSTIEGALANIANIENIPFLNTVPYNALQLTQDQAGQLNAGFAARIDGEVRKGVLFGASIQVISTEKVFTDKYISEKQAGKSDLESQQSAGAYIQSEAGKAEIGALVKTLTETQQPQELYEKAVQRYTEALTAEGDTDPNTTIISVFGKVLGPDFGTQVSAGVDAKQAETITAFKGMRVYPTFNAGFNGFVVEDETSPTKIRQLKEGEKMTLTFLAEDIASKLPSLQYIVPDRYALDAAELTNIREAITAYNGIILKVAQENTLAHVDMNAFFNQVVNGGVVVGGVRFTNAFVSGNAFSLDGVHLTQKGYALTARKFIEDINAYYGSSLPMPNLDNYPAVVFPQ